MERVFSLTIQRFKNGNLVADSLPVTLRVNGPVSPAQVSEIRQWTYQAIREYLDEDQSVVGVFVELQSFKDTLTKVGME